MSKRTARSRRFRPLMLGFAFAVALFDPGRAAALPFTGTLRIALGGGGATLLDQTATGAGSADLAYLGGAIESIANLPSGAFVFAGPTFPVTDPALVPIDSIRLDAQNGTGQFSSLTSGGGGPMGVLGAFTATALGGSIVFTTDDGSGQGIGLGGTFRADLPPSLLFLVLAGAPWTTGAVSNGFGSASGSTTADSVRLVSAFAYTSQNLGIPIEGIATLDLVFVPEPGTALLLGGGVALLAARSRSHVPRASSGSGAV